ncbi:MAG: OmpA family protein [Halothiobacillaceae bacterium]|nr:MAG: OmpA family protein [Halothiobacillaceae bacterium]
MKNFAALSTGLLVSAVLAAPAFAADKPTAYVYDSQKMVVKDGMGKCVLNGHIKLEASTAIKECNPEFFKEEAKAPEAKPAVEAPKAPVVAAKKITLNADTYFDFDKSNLKADGKKSLDGLVAEMKIDQIEQITVVGHTDSIGTDAYNQKLSERRAKTVADYLVSKGVPATKIKASGKGESQPIADNKTKAGRAKNRRVDVTVNAASK